MAVESHISPKTSEMWGTRGPWSRQGLEASAQDPKELPWLESASFCNQGRKRLMQIAVKPSARPQSLL